LGFGVGGGLGFGVWGLGFGVWGLGFGVWGLGVRCRVSGFEFQGLGFQVSGFGVANLKLLLLGDDAVLLELPLLRQKLCHTHSRQCRKHSRDRHTSGRVKTHPRKC